jgi:hypothetical protein
MFEILGVILVVILLVPFLRTSKYKEIERQQALRRAASRLQEKQRRFSS